MDGRSGVPYHFQLCRPFVSHVAFIDILCLYEQSEVTHGRVAMLAFVGLLVTEQPFEFHPLFTMGNKDIGPAMYVLIFLFELFACIGYLLRLSHLRFYCIFFSLALSSCVGLLNPVVIWMKSVRWHRNSFSRYRLSLD